MFLLFFINSYDTLVSVVLIHMSKMLTLLGVPSLTAASLCGMLMSYSLPFTLYLSYVPQQSSEITAGAHMGTPIVTFPVLFSAAFFASAGVNTIWASTHVFPFILTTVLSSQPSSVQIVCASLAAFSCFMLAFVTVFWRKAAALRRWKYCSDELIGGYIILRPAW